MFAGFGLIKHAFAHNVYIVSGHGVRNSVMASTHLGEARYLFAVTFGGHENWDSNFVCML